MTHRREAASGHSPRAAALVVFLLAGLVLGIGLSACQKPVVDSGVQGEVRIAPVNPVEQPGVENSALYSATLLVKEQGRDKVVAETTSAADGSFRIFLPPGDYVLEPVNGDPLPFATPQTFTVEAGAFTFLRVGYDSGIR